MKWLYAVILFAAGTASGWLSHSYIYKHEQSHDAAPRQGVRKNRAPTPDTRQPDTESRPPAPQDHTQGKTAQKKQTDGDVGAAVLSPEEEEQRRQAAIARLTKMMKPQWKAFAQMGGIGRLRAMLRELGFDDETAAEIEKLLMNDLDRQMDSLIAAMMGDGEIDPDMVTAMFGIPPDLSPKVESAIGTFLNDDEVSRLRQGVKKSHKEQMRVMADAQIGIMGLPNLHDDQRERLRGVFLGQDTMSQQLKTFGAVFRDPKIRNDPKALEAMVRTGFGTTRGQVNEILNPEQLKAYEAFEDRTVGMVKMQMKMMSAMFKPDEKRPSK